MNALDHFLKGEQLLARAEKKNPNALYTEDVPAYALIVATADAHFRAAQTMLAALSALNMPAHDYEAWERHAFSAQTAQTPDDSCPECEGKGRNCAAHGGRPGIPYLPMSDKAMTPPRILVRAADTLDAQGWIQNGDYQQHPDRSAAESPVDLAAALALAAGVDMHSSSAAYPPPGAHADAVLLLARRVIGVGPHTETASRALDKLTTWQDEDGRTVEQVTAALRAAAAEPAIGIGYPVPGSAIPDMPGYVVGTCGDRVALSEWRTGMKTCERCPDDQDHATHTTR